MPRETYDECTPETKQAIAGYVYDLSEEWHKTERHIYNILAGRTTDPFAPFKPLFRAAARVNPVGTHGYIDTLESIYRVVVPAHKLPRINYGTDVIEDQAQIAYNRFGMALAKKDSQLILKRSRELRAVLDSLERKYMMEGREDSPREKEFAPVS